MKTFSIKFGILIVMISFIYACGQQGWSEREKKDFVKGCLKRNNGKISEERAREACNCMLNKMMDRYPTMVASQKIDLKELKEVAISCLKTNNNTIENNTVLHKSKDGKIGLLLKNWKDIDPNGCNLRAKNKDTQITVIVQDTKAIKPGVTKKDVLLFYVKDIMSKRQNAKKEVPLKEIKYNDKIIYQLVYTADRENSRNLYCFNVIDFKSDSDQLAVVIFNGLPPYKEEKNKEWNTILKSTKIFK